MSHDKTKTLLPSSSLDLVFAEFPDRTRGVLIPLLQRVQEIQSYLSQEAIRQIAHYLKIPVSKVYGVATFYNQFKFMPPGQHHIQICRGTACHVEGSLTLFELLRQELKINAGETTKDGLFSLEIVSCIGACGLAPVISIDGEFYAKVTGPKIKEILKTLRAKAKEKENQKVEMQEVVEHHDN